MRARQHTFGRSTFYAQYKQFAVTERTFGFPTAQREPTTDAPQLVKELCSLHLRLKPLSDPVQNSTLSPNAFERIRLRRNFACKQIIL